MPGISFKKTFLGRVTKFLMYIYIYISHVRQDSCCLAWFASLSRGTANQAANRPLALGLLQFREVFQTLSTMIFF